MEVKEKKNEEVNDVTKVNTFRCMRCGKIIKKPSSIRNGMGSTCYKKHMKELKKYCIPLF